MSRTKTRNNRKTTDNNNSRSNNTPVNNSRLSPRKAAAKSVNNIKAKQAEMTHNEILAINQVTTRFMEMMRLLDERRDVYEECGYPETSKLTAKHYQHYYDRHPIAARVVELLPKECWQVHPTVYETEDPTPTKFEESWDAINKQLRGEKSWYQDEESGAIWDYMLRADIASGIGSYGIILIGLDDVDESGNGRTLDQPAEFFPDGVDTPVRKLLYLRVFSEAQASIIETEEDTSSPRYGQPTMYEVTLSEDGSNIETQEVHWTRVIHIADNILSSEVYGIPRMQQVFNNLFDLEKLYGGSAEMYWAGASPGLALMTNPEAGSNPTVNFDALKTMMEEYYNRIQKYIALKNMKVQSLSPNVSSPRDQIDIQIEAISINKGVPKRKLMGSERGELASSQDEDDWNGVLEGRQGRYLTPRMIVGTVDRFLLLGLLARPQQGRGFSVWWPPISAQSVEQKATIAEKIANTIKDYIDSNAETLIAPIDFLTKVLWFTDEEAEAILDNAETLAREMEEAGRRALESVADTDDDNPNDDDDNASTNPDANDPNLVKE